MWASLFILALAESAGVPFTRAEAPVEMTVGSPPMEIEDTDTPGDGIWEINLGLEIEWGQAERRVSAPVVEIEYGVGDRLQVSLELPYVFVRDGGDDGEARARVHGVGDAGFGLKYRFYGNEERGLSLAVHPELRVRMGSVDLEVSEGGSTIALPLVLTSEFERFSSSAIVGTELGEGERHWFGGAGFGWRLDERTAVLVDLLGSNLGSSAGNWAAGLGLRRKLDDKNTLSASIGRDISTGEGQAAEYRFRMAWGTEFGD
jgi:hypothetical protein